MNNKHLGRILGCDFFVERFSGQLCQANLGEEGKNSSERFGETDVWISSGVLDHEIGWKQCFGDLLL